ncbi:MAG: nuclear transport factor 2 family protein [Rhodoluna sp.]
MTDPGIQTLLDNYFELMHTQDMSLFDKVFHKDSNLYSSENDEIVIRPAGFYRGQMEARTSPQDSGNARRDEVLLVDQISPELAMAKVQLEMFGGVMQDYLSLLHVDGSWFVISKLYKQVGKSA